MMAQRVLVTGGSGFLGSSIVRALVEKHPGWTVAILDLGPGSSRQFGDKGVEYFEADLTNPQQASTVVAAFRPSVIIHNAGAIPKGKARNSRAERDTVFNVNVNGTKNMLAAAKEHGVRAFVYTSSCTIITDDLNHHHPNMTEAIPSQASLIYGQSKAEAELLVLNANDSPNFLTTALRPSVIVGPGDENLVPTIHACIAKGETPFIVGDGLNLYDFAYVDNVADAHVLAVENLMGTATAAGEAFFISNMEPIPFRVFCLAVWKEFGHIPPYEVNIPQSIAWLAGLAAEAWTWMTGTSAMLSRGTVKDSCQIGYANCSKAHRTLGYQPRVGLVKGVRLACEDYKKRLQQNPTALGNGNGVRPRKMGVNAY